MPGMTSLALLHPIQLPVSVHLRDSAPDVLEPCHVSIAGSWLWPGSSEHPRSQSSDGSLVSLHLCLLHKTIGWRECGEADIKFSASTRFRHTVQQH